MREFETLDKICLYWIQTSKRESKGMENQESKCYSCKGKDIWCNDYIPLLSQRQLMEVMGRGL